MAAIYQNNCHSVGNLYKYFDKIDTAGFWSIRLLLTYNKPFIFVTGSRSLGKTTSVGIFVLLDFIENGYKFIYMRRRETELKKSAYKFFNNAAAILRQKCGIEISVEWKNGVFTAAINGGKPQTIGYSVALSLQDDEKSTDYSDVGTIVFEEFLPYDKTKYLGSYDTDPAKEPALFNLLYGTVDRTVDTPFRNATRAIFMGNTATVYNPFFVEYGILKYLYNDEKARIISPKNAPWVLERIKGVEATKDFQKSILYAISSDKQREYNFENSGVLDDMGDRYIGQPGISHTMRFCRLNGKLYKISRDNDFLFYISQHRGQPTDRVYSMDITSHTAGDYELIQRWHGEHVFVMVLDAFTRGELLFDNPGTRGDWMRYLNLIK